MDPPFNADRGNRADGVAILISPAQAAVNLPELRDVICEHWETRGGAEPDEAVGADGELGRCQVKAESARLAGSEVKPSKLLGPDSAAANREAALLILHACHEVERRALEQRVK